MPSVVTFIPSTQNPVNPVQAQYAPPNWATQKVLYSIVVNDQTTNSPIVPDANNPGQFTMKTNVAGSTTTMFVFDAIRRADHDQSCIPTKKPLQTGYNSSDHAVLQPALIVLEAVMSDAIASYSTGMWSGNPSKSVSAFQQMITLMKNRALITLNTRLQTYTNCLLTNVRCADGQRYYYGAELILTFEQLIISTVSVQFNSARSQTTGSTGLGTVQTQNPSASTLNQFTTNQITDIPGAGQISSNVVPN
jgi:hypothetical protein